MMDDPIVEEVRRIRDRQAAESDYDLDKIFRALKAVWTKIAPLS